MMRMLVLWHFIAFVSALSDYEREYGTRLSKLPSDELVEESLKTLGFGSCQKAKYDMTKIYNSILEHNPEIFLFIGDNTYPDLLCCTPECLKYAYEMMEQNESYRQFTKKVKKFDGIYDDHDYGINDGDGTYIHKKISHKYLLDFFGKPKDHYRRKRSGAYFSISYINPKDPQDHVKVIVLDTRYNRDCFYDCICRTCYLTFVKSRAIFIKRLFNALTGIGCNHVGDVLGEEQWEWLQGQLYNSDAKAHVIVSSFQIFTTFPVSESWGLLPNAKKRFLDLLKATKPMKPLVLSGDVHYGEIIQNKGLVEITSSSLSHSLCHHTRNRHKMIRFMLSFYKTEIYLSNNYGIIKFDYNPSTGQMAWDGGIFNEDGERILGYISPFEEDLYKYVDDKDSFFVDYKIIKCKNVLEILHLFLAIVLSLSLLIALPYALWKQRKVKKQ